MWGLGVEGGGGGGGWGGGGGGGGREREFKKKGDRGVYGGKEKKGLSPRGGRSLVFHSWRRPGGEKNIGRTSVRTTAKKNDL